MTKPYGGKRVLHGVSLAAPDGAVTGFVGPNGAGKSTPLRIEANLSDQDRGSAPTDGGIERRRR